MNPMTGNNTAQLDLLLQAAFNSLLSSGQMQPPMATAKPMKLLELAMALENQRRAAVFPKWPLAELALAQPIPMQLPTMLPTCTPPDFHSRLMATFPSPIAFHGQTSIQEGLADSAIPSPSDTSGSSSQDDRQCRAHNGRGNGRTHRLSYPREFKLIVLHSFWANGQNKYRTCKEFQITKSMLNGWLQKADKIRNSRPGSLKSGRSGRRPQFPGIESQLFELFRAQLAKGERISNKWIRANARRLAGETNAGNDRNCAAATVNDDGATAQCQFSERWLNNFKRRFGIQTGPKDGELMLPEGVPLTVECTGETSAVNNATIQDVDESSDANCQTPPLVDAMSEANWAKIGREICASANGCGQLPIQAFFARFPKIVSGQQGVEQ